VIHYDLWWNPAVENQATDRAYRIGQDKNVMVHRFICKDTFEERIDAMIQKKKALADMTIASGENWIGKLSNTELREIFG
jgi:SNF2 family DNA or RNA helicase